ncbi:MAG: DUF5615 family PIN-like protein [Burkholderiales bacterium]
MKFLIDAQLPRRFADWLIEAGHNALHTLDLPMKNRTTDIEGAFVANRFVEITRDALIIHE